MLMGTKPSMLTLIRHCDRKHKENLYTPSMIQDRIRYYANRKGLDPQKTESLIIKLRCCRE